MQGFGTPIIGSLTVHDGVQEMSAAIQVNFDFSPAFAFLDNFYDFRWVNVQLTYTVGDMVQTTDPVTGKLPGIDPQPGGSEDLEPFYYNDTEWNSGTFGSLTIHTENVSSIFSDSPDDAIGNTIGFMLSLVAEDVSAGNFPDDTVEVLHSLVWGWAWGSDTGNVPISAFGSFLAGGNFVTINEALSNSGAPGFGNFNALGTLVLIPIPAAVYLFGSALGLVGWMRRKAA